jgi:hypothetical protein
VAGKLIVPLDIAHCEIYSGVGNLTKQLSAGGISTTFYDKA